MKTASGGLSMLSNAILISLAIMSAAAALNMLRLLKGPDLPDRILALDTLYINALAIIILLGLYLASDLFFEAALIIAVMGFVGTVAVAKHLLRGDIIE
jgi:multicomponent K+:H+ antiporter subunit F